MTRISLDDLVTILHLVISTEAEIKSNTLKNDDKLILFL